MIRSLSIRAIESVTQVLLRLGDLSLRECLYELAYEDEGRGGGRLLRDLDDRRGEGG